MLFDTIRHRSLTDDACFLCGDRLTPKNRTDEHVVPVWAQQRFDLSNQQLGLSNGTSIPYRQLTIPCCERCNNRFLQPVETKMAAATLEGPEAVQRLDKTTVFTWLGKIFYGLFHRELFLLFDRRQPDEGGITSPELLQQFSLHHYFLQNVRVPMTFDGGFPASIFIYETQAPLDARLQWDFRDSIENMFISVRCGRVGMIAVLHDGGAQELMRDAFNELVVYPLHPLQHVEISALVCYRALLLNRTPKYVIADSEPIQVVLMPLGGLSRKPIFDDWDPVAYAKLLAEFTRIPVDQLYVPGSGTFTWLRHPDGSPKEMRLEVFPWPVRPA